MFVTGQLTQMTMRRTHVSMSRYDDCTESSDAHAMVCLQSGDRGALALLYGRHHVYLVAIGLKMLRSRAEAEDVVHDVFVEAWQRAGDYRPDRASVRTWLAMRMRSRCLDRVRSAAVARSETLPDGYDEPSHYSANQMPRHIDGKRAAAAVNELPTQQREVLELGYFKGYSSTEIATELDIPTGTVKSRVRAAIGRLRGRLQEEA